MYFLICCSLLLYIYTEVTLFFLPFLWHISNVYRFSGAIYYTQQNKRLYGKYKCLGAYRTLLFSIQCKI